jgi:dTDP-4-amino-4,6-dideoxygalactose transaminase
MIPFLELKQVTAAHGEEIHEAVRRVVDSGWYLHGEETERFEYEYARYIGSRHCVGVANGLDALNWIFRGYLELGRLQPGDEVIVPANTFIATILAITDNGLTPVLVEPDIRTLEMDDSLIEEKISARTKAICIVHLYGRCAYTEKVRQLCDKYHLLLIEDNAQAHGCKTPEGKRTGSLGDAAGHSFYPGKNLGALGDAGAVTTDDDDLATAIRSLANYGSSKKYVFQYRGRNSRIDEVQAAVLSVKLKHLDEDNAHRAEVAHYYYGYLADVPGVILPDFLPDAQNVYHLFPILCERRDKLQCYLKDRGIQTVIHYPIPPHKQECYREWNTLSLPITERMAEKELSLPISPALRKEETIIVCDTISLYYAYLFDPQGNT